MFVRYAGHVGQQTGFGRAAIDNCRALIRAGVDLQLVSLGRMDDPAPPDLLAAYERSDADDVVADATIIHTLPFDCARTLRLLHDNGFRAKKDIAYTTWETPTAPIELAESLRAFHQVWTPSRASSQAIRSHGGAYENGPLLVGRVHEIPHCFDPSDQDIALALSTGGERPGHPAPSGPTRFLWIGAWTARKNPMGVIRAFAHQFTRDDDVELVMHSPGADLITCYAAMAQTGLEQTQLPRITISNDYRPRERVWEMIRQADVFVSASRGEAWNLPAFEAMIAGKWVIVTAEQGSDDFLWDPANGVETNAIRIPSRADLAHVSVTAHSSQDGSVGFTTKGAQGLTSRMLWQEPDLLSLSLEMHHAYKLCLKGALMHVGYSPQQKFGYDTVAKLMIERIQA